MAGLLSRIKTSLKHGWNIFTDSNYLDGLHTNSGEGYGYYAPPSRNRSSYIGERTTAASIYTRIAIDVAGIDIRHVRTDDQGRYQSDMVSGLQDCLTVDPNIDQVPRQFKQDIAMTLIERGVIAIVPVETTLNPDLTSGFDIQQLRVGEIVGWQPQHVRVSLYDDRVGQRKVITVPKRLAAVVENPLYSVMNEPNSTMQRLIKKIGMLDNSDEVTSSGKLDLIIQLPYVVRSETKRQQAEQRRKDIEFQLTGSKYGIAYADGTEKITQLNRPVTNNLLEEIKYLTDKLYSELGVTPEIMNGTADEKVMLNYYNRTIEPIVQAFTEAMKRSFLTKTARTQKQSIMYFRDPFKLVPMDVIADIADKFSRNEVLTSNEIRQGIGFRPSKDPKADQLVNSNMPQPNNGIVPPVQTSDPYGTGTASSSDPTANSDAVIQSGLDEANTTIDQIYSTLGISDG